MARSIWLHEQAIPQKDGRFEIPNIYGGSMIADTDTLNGIRQIDRDAQMKDGAMNSDLTTARHETDFQRGGWVVMTSNGTDAGPIMDAVDRGIGRSYVEALEQEMNRAFMGGIGGIMTDPRPVRRAPAKRPEPANWDDGKIVDDVIEQHFPAARMQALEREKQLLGSPGRLQKMRMPKAQRKIYESRSKVIASAETYQSALALAVECGYQPYSLPANWYAGVVAEDEPEYDSALVKNVEMVFNAPIPLEVLEKLNAAMDTDLFSGFVVGAPDRSLFKLRTGVEETQPMLIDPVIIGYVATGDNARIASVWESYGISYGLFETPGNRINTGIAAHDVQGFLIAYWDLSGDLEFLEQGD